MISKLVSLESLIDALAVRRAKGQAVVFTNGCFDILHAGHVRYLNQARALGDLLIIGLNSDRSVSSIKGDKRPLVFQAERAEVLAALACVDYLVLFDDPTPFSLISALKPDILVKGADWAEENIVGADLVKSWGGQVARIPLLPGISTSEIIRRIVARYSQ